MIDKKKKLNTLTKPNVSNSNKASKINKSTRSSTNKLFNVNITSMDVNEIDEIIKNNQIEKKQYSKSQVELYTPLTNKEKMKVLEDLNNNSDMRIMLYSELFKEIKQQINTLSNIPVQTTTSNIKYSMDNIKEEDVDEEDMKFEESQFKDLKNKPKNRLFINNRNNFERTQSKGMLDWRDSEENIGLIYVPQIICKSNTLQNVDLLSNPKFIYKESRRNAGGKGICHL